MTQHSVTEMNVAIAESLGLDLHRIRKGGVTLTLDGNLGPILEVQYLTMTPEMTSNFVDHVTQRYKLVPLEDEDDEDEGAA